MQLPCHTHRFPMRTPRCRDTSVRHPAAKTSSPHRQGSGGLWCLRVHCAGHGPTTAPPLWGVHAFLRAHPSLMRPFGASYRQSGKIASLARPNEDRFKVQTVRVNSFLVLILTQSNETELRAPVGQSPTTRERTHALPNTHLKRKCFAHSKKAQEQSLAKAE
jgi:hypothetical protein